MRTIKNFFISLSASSPFKWLLLLSVLLSLTGFPQGAQALRLQSFKAFQIDNRVLLQWHAGNEIDNLGFHIYREQTGRLYQVTPQLIAGSAFLTGPATALRSGDSYSWWDRSSLSPVSYWLEDWDLNGKRTMHGPVVPVFTDQLTTVRPSAPLLSEIGTSQENREHDFLKVQELRENLRQGPLKRLTQAMEQTVILSNDLQQVTQPSRKVSTNPSNQLNLAAGPAVKLLVRKEGWYRVTQPELVAAELDPTVDPKKLQLFVDGEEQSILVTGEKDKSFDPEDAIEFYGVGLDTPFTDTRVYWLVEGNKSGKRIKQTHGRGARLAADSFLFTVERKDRTVHFGALKNGDAENFFGPIVPPPWPSTDKFVNQLITISNLDPSPQGEAALEVGLQGASMTPHRVRIFLNEIDLGVLAFKEQRKGKFSASVSQSRLLAGDNIVTLKSEGGDSDVTLVDYIRLSYWHTFTADDDVLKLRAKGAKRLSLKGFSNPNIRVFDITNPEAVREAEGTVESEGAGYAITFKVPGTGRRTLMALTEDKIRTPEAMVANVPSLWHENDYSFDLLIISHGDFVESLQPLKALRESQGFTVALIDVEDLYDEFNFGTASPYAVKDFLHNANTAWEKAPKFVLFVGDASFDPKNYLGFGYFDLVPTKRVETYYLETSSDDWFVDFNEDGLPEMATGRIPVRTAQEADIVVSKISGYESSSEIMNEVLFVANNTSYFEYDYEAATDEIADLVPGDLNIKKIYRSSFGASPDPDNDALATAAVLASINQGPLLVNYFGYGATDMWEGGLLRSSHVSTLTNGIRLPFFINMTAFNGLFTDVYSPYGSLAKTLLKAEDGGAVAVWASSGFTQPEGQTLMDEALIELLFNGEGLTLGEAAARAKASTKDQDVRGTWILFGDPTTKLKY
jgi:hypothetical protein